MVVHQCSSKFEQWLRTDRRLGGYWWTWSTNQVWDGCDVSVVVRSPSQIATQFIWIGACWTWWHQFWQVIVNIRADHVTRRQELKNDFASYVELFHSKPHSCFSKPLHKGSPWCADFFLSFCARLRVNKSRFGVKLKRFTCPKDVWKSCNVPFKREKWLRV